ncbi:MAG: SHOCT domain-containing protein [Alphaproteobacteria bacterium]|nr:SHOCT domain-containing protein [Alphaproteobacteria bacterium]
MDLEKLEKINELKEKGILSEDEFNKMKQQLLSDNTVNNPVKAESNKKKGVNWKNVGISFLITVATLVILGIVGVILEETGIIIADENEWKAFWRFFYIFLGVIYAIIASKLETKKYKNCAGAGTIFLVFFLFGPLAQWAGTYEFLQIKQGNAILKDKK